jgi:two-component sensor histidine kinase/PAS domain-containing protein
MFEARKHSDEAPSGLAATPALRWGSHVGHLFEAADELHDVLVPYFKAGLENNERCLWVTGAPFDAVTARAALRNVLPDLEDRERGGQVEIVDGAGFYDASKPLPGHELVAGLVKRAEDAVAAGFTGLRTNGNCAWVGQQQWLDFQHYESLVQQNIRGRRMICMCSYHADKLQSADMIDVLDHHDIVLRRRSGRTTATSSTKHPTLDTNAQLRSANDLPTMDAWLKVDQAILDALPIGFYCCDSLGQIVRANRRAVALWGQPVRLLDLTQRFCGSFRIESLDGKFISPEESPMARAVLHGETFEGTEAIVTNPDGHRWVARVQVAPLRDRAGRIVGAINCFEDVSAEHGMRLALERQQRTFDLAMVASQMGTWRYTLADNICSYDDNAQRLYGLTEARFLHDEHGVKDKFHPDDLELMWARVAHALDPAGDGRYDIEYRVKQRDGSWRWLSAWGTVEFDGHGPNRKPVAISGASRDLSDLKKADELQRLLVNELNHRVKNTLATVQAIVAYTLHRAPDLQFAREELNKRIVSLARVHELLTLRNWTGANLRDVVHRALEPFAATQLEISGPSVELSPNHTLALSLGLHELATNASKYGALSAPHGRIQVQWAPAPGQIKLHWRESGGPLVTPPTRRGFGSRLLEDALARDLGGTKLEYTPEGVRCEFTVVL